MSRSVTSIRFLSVLSSMLGLAVLIAAKVPAAASQRPCQVRVTIGLEPGASALVGSRMFATATLNGDPSCPAQPRYKFRLSADGGQTFTMRQDYTGRQGAACSTPPPPNSNCYCVGGQCYAHRANQLQFAPMTEGNYVVQAFVKDGDDGRDEWETWLPIMGTSDPLAVGARATTVGVVTTTNLGWVNDKTGVFVDNPTVALYSAPACLNPGDTVSVEYAAHNSNVLVWNPAQSAPLSCYPKTANVWVTGLRPNTNHLIRHRINGGAPSCTGIDNCPQTGSRPLPTPGPTFPLWTRYTNLDGTSLYYAPFDITVYLFAGALAPGFLGPAAATPLAIDKYGTCLDGTTAFPCTPTPRWYYWPQNDGVEFRGFGNQRFFPSARDSSSPATFLGASRLVEDASMDAGGQTDCRLLDLAGNPVFELNARALQHRFKVAYGCVGGACQWNSSDVPVIPILEFHRDWQEVRHHHIALAGTKKCLPNVGDPNTDGEPDGRSAGGTGTALVGPWWNCNVETQTNSTDALGTGTANGKWWSGDLIVAVDSEGRLDGGRGWVWNSFDHLDPHNSTSGAFQSICIDIADRCTTGPQCNVQSGCYNEPYNCTVPTGGHVGGDCLVRGLREYLHTNAVFVNTDGSLVVSLRRQNNAAKIDYRFGSGDGHVIWALGAGGDFCTHEPGTNTCRTYNNQDPLGATAPWSQWPNPSNFFTGQHYPHLSGNDFLVYDNGNRRCDQDPLNAGDLYLCGTPPDDNPSGFQLARGQVWSLTFNPDGTPNSADPTLNFTLGPRPDDSTNWIFTISVGSAQKLPGTGPNGYAGSQNMLFLAGNVKVARNPSTATASYIIEVARDMQGNPTNAYRSKVQAIIPGNSLITYRAFSTSAVADGSDPPGQ